jgi:UDP-N-acetylmuramate: L-alanyl-gamma-D-glutamyl-meso-diaminopimelate ligase
MSAITTERVHMIGIGGSAMAAVAGLLAERGFKVTGSDLGVYPPASTLLESLGIRWTNGFAAANLEPRPDWVVVGNAVSRGNPEVEAMLDAHLRYRSLPQVLEEFFIPGHDSIVVSGTHGKTTTTSLLAWICEVAGRKPNFLIGGVAENFGRSYGLGGGEEIILEGDEYDSAFFDKAPKFLHYHPDELIVTSLEFDHADIYADLAAIELQFRRLVNLVPRSGRIVAWGESPAVMAAVRNAFCRVETYGFGADTDWTAGDIEFVDGATEFRIAQRGREVARIRSPLSGRHNVLNVAAAAAIALGRGVERQALEEAIGSFRNVLRRMEVKGEAGGVLVVDDFAHHPTAIGATIEAARTRWPGRRLWAIFEPRSNTMRRRAIESDLSAALATADAAILGSVHRQQLLSDEERLSPQRVVESVRAAGKTAEAFGSAGEIAEYLAEKSQPGDLALVMSNGSFDGLCNLLLQGLSERESARRVHRT